MKSSKYLPPEIWTQIFAKLPARTLLRIRCVCKSWCSIIDNPDFIHLHLQLSQINSANSQLFVVLDEWSLTLPDSQTPRDIGCIFWKSNIYTHCIVGSCNGLLLVVGHLRFCSDDELRLWNPCIRKSLLLPTCPLTKQFGSSNIDYLLGFAPDSKDYKVVAFESERTRGIGPRKIQFAVYTLRDQLWTVNPTSMMSLDFLSLAVILRGAAYWLVNNDTRRSGLLTHLRSFDFDKERITFLELPISLDKTSFLWFLFLLGDSLAIFTISKVTSSIWVLEKDSIKLSWRLWFSGKSSPEGYELFKSCESYEKVYYCKSDGGYFVCGGYIYNIVSCQVQKFYRSMNVFSQLERYSESLVLSKGYGARDLRVFQ